MDAMATTNEATTDLPGKRKRRKRGTSWRSITKRTSLGAAPRVGGGRDLHRDWLRSRQAVHFAKQMEIAAKKRLDEARAQAGGVSSTAGGA